MGKIKVFTDSACDLSPELIEKYEISVVPLYVGFDEESLKDGIDITPEELFREVEKRGKLPKTSAPSPNDFYIKFKPFIDEEMDIIYVGLSSKLSSTLQNAIIAAKEFPEGRIEIVDSMNLSTGIGLLVLKACDFAKEGLNIHEIAEEVKTRVSKIKTAFIVDTLDYLYMGGRCSALQNFMSGILQIRPIIKVVDGRMILGDKTRGKREKALNTMLENALIDKDNMELDRIMITHSFGSNDGPYLRDNLIKEIKVKDGLITVAGCVISSHCGPNTIGILYITK